jgi:hypothetical protein
LVFSEEMNKTEQEFTGVTLWGVFRALKQVKVTGKVTSYSTRFALCPIALVWRQVRGYGGKTLNVQVA